MTEICLLRHGQTEWNTVPRIQGMTDNPLNEEGKNQAIQIGTYLQQNDPTWDILVTSPLVRASQTATIVGEILGYQKEILQDADCIERSFGELEGSMLNSETYDLIFEEKVIGMESIDSLTTRSIRFLEKLAKNHPGKRILVATHSQFIKAAIGKLDNTFNFRSWLKNASLNYFVVDDTSIQLKAYNISYDNE